MRRRIALLVAPAVASVAILAGCGEDSEVSSAAEPPGVDAFAGQPDPEALEEFEECLREEGIEPPEPQVAPGGPGGGAPEEFEAPSDKELEAFEACGEALPGGAPAPGGDLMAPAPAPGS